MEVNIDEMDYIVEIYDIPAEYTIKDLVAILREYRKKYLLVRWVNNSTALGIFDTAENANNAIRGLDHHTVKCRSLAEASHESIIKASTHDRHLDETNDMATGRDKESTGQKLRLIFEGDDDDVGERCHSNRSARGRPSNRRGRGERSSQSSRRSDLSAGNALPENARGRGRGRGSGINGRGRAQSAESTRFATRKQMTDLNPDVMESLNDTLDELHLSSQPNREQKRKPFLKYEKLDALSKMEDDPEGVLFEIGHSRSGFQELLEKDNLNYDHLFRILKIIVIVNASTEMGNKRKVLLMFEDSFLDRLNDILNGISMNSESTKGFWQNKDKLSRICNLCTQALSAVMGVIRNSLGKYKSIIRVLTEIQETFGLGDELITEIQGCSEVLKSLKEENDMMHRTTVENKKQRKNQSDENKPPPDNFREIAILPCLKDLQLDEKPFLRANKCKGKYQDLETYLDIQFRLLREDYMQPLRSGIAEYKRNIRQGLSVKKIRDIRLYHSVQILRPVCSRSGINYVLQFDTSPFKSINWAASRRLLHGSLLCLSSDHFETNFYATVKERKLDDLKDGLLEVHIEMTEDIDMNANSTFVMAETTAFFEAYRHILAGLQEIDETLPFQRYLVNCEPTVKPPKYLLYASPHYDFSCILEKATHVSSVPVLNSLHWPKPSQLGFDESQFEALKTAITKEVAIIQGPPGTGKTYVGLKITELLLENKQTWSNGAPGKPILVVCYTNHALDQFLEGISKFCTEGIVRLGGRCKEEALNEYVLSNIKKKRRQEKSRSFKVLQNERDCYSKLRHFESMISQVSKRLKSSTAEIFPLKLLESFMTKSQRGSFTRLMQRLGKDAENTCISHWLNVKPISELNVPVKDEFIRKKLEWELFIVSSIKEMTDTEKAQVEDVWQLNLHERAKLYKSWVSEAKGRIQQILSTSTDISLMQNLESMELDLNQNIQNVQTLRKLVSTETTKTQLHKVTNGGGYSQDPLFDWLALDGKEESAAKIKEAMSVEETIRDYEEKDFEEDRELDDDNDDDFLSEYAGGRNNTGESNTDSWEVAYRKSKTKQAVREILSKATKLEKEEAHAIDNILEIPFGKRRDLYKYWLDEYRVFLREKIKGFETEFSAVSKELQEVADIETIEILNGSVFMGMTTTGAAKYRSVLQKIRPRIVIVEEAAEVLESHIVTSLNKDCEHLILIGDHKQLRPSTTVYELSKKYHLDISLFERMVMNGMPCVTLREQHRMRPEISELLRYQNLYPNLHDHVDVTKYPDVKGVDGNFRFICHAVEESRSAESTSYSNIYEAKYIASFTRYLLKQGYTSDQITVLTPYMGQVLLLRKNMPKIEFQGVRITAVDNYQGEENEIVLLSLVRSSQTESKGVSKNPIGFVGIENRICVALSRAKIGFYVIGNFDLFKLHSDMWQYMTSVMHDKNRMSTVLTLRCQNHQDRCTAIEKLEDFRKVPDGGCELSCQTHLPCGHICPRACHVLDKDHKLFKCLKPCTKRICALDHQCTKKCFQDCGKCNVFVEKILPLCKHKEKIPCHMEPLRYFCTKTCPKTLKCGHPCQKRCGDCTRDRGGCQDKCTVTVTKRLQCGHEIEAACSEDVSAKLCQKSCTAILSCSHSCAGSCTKCLCGKIHERCNGTCPKTLACGHKCSFPCSEICPPCPRKCQWKCSHSLVCKNNCSSACIKCEEKCTFGCRHRKCTRSCHEDCDVRSCVEPCTRKLECGHTCNGLCGEKCLCVTCADAATQSRLSDINDDTIRYIKMPDCSCLVEVVTLDMTMKKTEFSRTDMCKRCPIEECRKPITSLIWRYANILKQCRRDIFRRNETLFGTPDSRHDKARELMHMIKPLKLSGLAEDGAAILEKMIKSPSARLNYLSKAMDRLAEVLKVRQTEGYKCIAGQLSQNWSSSPVHPNLIVQLLLSNRKISTKQFWDDIDIETQRIRLYALMNNKDLNSGRIRMEVIVPGLVSAADRRLTENTPFDSIRYNAVADLYNLLNDLENGKSVSSSELYAIKHKLDRD